VVTASCSHNGASQITIINFTVKNNINC